MQTLLTDIRDWFDARHEHLLAFALSDCRLEGWFKGELLVLLRQLQRAKRIAGFEREASIASRETGRRVRVDFRIRLAGETHLCELKALCISRAAGPRDLAFYFREDEVGLIKDFRKLDALEGKNKWVLAFVYPRPKQAAWDAAVASLPKGLAHWKPATRLADASEALFVCLWRAELAQLT